MLMKLTPGLLSKYFAVRKKYDQSVQEAKSFIIYRFPLFESLQIVEIVLGKLQIRRSTCILIRLCTIDKGLSNNTYVTPNFLLIVYSLPPPCDICRRYSKNVTKYLSCVIWQRCRELPFII
jgi:hypothetical protein